MSLRREDREVIFQTEPVAAHMPFNQILVVAAQRREPFSVGTVQREAVGMQVFLSHFLELLFFLYAKFVGWVAC